MGINHRSSHIAVTQQLLDGACVLAILEQVSGEGVPQRMTSAALLNQRFPHRGADGLLKGTLMNVMASLCACARVTRSFRSGKDELLGPFARHVR